MQSWVNAAKSERHRSAAREQTRHRRLTAATIFLAILLTGALVAPRELGKHFLVACGFLLTIGLGGLFFALLHYAVAARWSVHAIRHVRCVLELLAISLLFIVPLVWRFDHVMRWFIHPVAGSRTAFHTYWHREEVVLLRLLLCYAVWFVLAYVYSQRSHRTSLRPLAVGMSHLRALSGPALIVLGVTLTSFSFDWIIALQHGWHSAVMGIYVFSGGVSAALAFLAIFTLARDRLGFGMWPVDLDARHDLAKLLFGFNAFWGYVAFSQYLLIWYANIPAETEFYHRRTGPAWQWLTLALIVVHFVLPFCCLLSARAKRAAPTLLIAAFAVLFGHWLDWSWLVLPALSPQGTGRGLSTLVLIMTGLTMAAVVMTGLIRELQVESDKSTVPLPAE